LKEILRKCKVCDKGKNKTIKIEEEKYIFYENSYYHYDCFIKYRIEKKKYNKSLTYEEAKIIADKLVIKTSESNTINNSIDRDRLTYWLYDNYNVTVLPSTFFIKLKQINDGTFSMRINAPITYHDLLQIFKKMKTHLDKINNKNERNGKEIDIFRRIDYDLAIVINNYDKYLQWKQKQKTEEIEKIEIINDLSIKNNMQINTITSLQKKNKQNKQNDKDEINISNILDEVF
jgi:hypothetical protein